MATKDYKVSIMKPRKKGIEISESVFLGKQDNLLLHPQRVMSMDVPASNLQQRWM